MKNKLIRTATVAMSLNYLLKGQLSFLNEHYEVIAVSGEDEHLQEVHEREKVRTENVRIHRTISLLKDLKSLWELYLLFRKEKPHIVHSITPKAGLLSMVAAKMTGVPVRIHTFTGLIFPEKKGFLQQILILMDRLICFCATDIFPEGVGVKSDLIKYKITSKPLKIIANGNVNGIDTAYFSKDQVLFSEQETLKKELGICNDDFVFIFVGRLVGDKGINELISAFKAIASQNRKVKLVLVGPLESDLDPLHSHTLKEIKDNDAIISIGFKKDVRPYFAISDALVFPSYREGFPNVVLQAGAMGLPAIVTDINGSNEIIKEGINGLIIPAKDEVALKQAMHELMDNKCLYDKLKFNARDWITSRYEQKRVWELLLLEYKNKSREKTQKLIRITTVPLSLKTLLKGQHRFMSQYYQVIGVSSDASELFDVAIDEGIKVIPIEMTRVISPWQDLKALWHLFCFFKKEKPFIVHTHTPKAGTLGMLAAKLAGVPHRLHTVAGLPLLEATGFKRKLLNAVEKATYTCATKIYPNSFGLRDIILQEQFCKPNKLKVLGNGSSNGIDTTYFNPANFTALQNQQLKNSLEIQASEFVFIFIGRLVGDKGINELVSAFKKLKNQESKPENKERLLLHEPVDSKLKAQNSKLLIVGPLESELDPLKQETLKEIATNPDIISVGFQKDVRPYFAISDCLAFPSYREGFPNVVLQAGAMGLPSIITNINGSNEIITEGQNGSIIPVKDIDALYEAMKIMVDKVDFRTQLQQNARPMIIFRYEQQFVWEAILSEYRRLEKNV